jgi:hypothetical protein
MAASQRLPLVGTSPRAPEGSKSPDLAARFSALRQPGQKPVFFRHRRVSPRWACPRRRAAMLRSWLRAHQRFRSPDCQRRAGVQEPVRYRNQSQHLSRSTGVVSGFSASLDYSLRRQSFRWLQVPTQQPPIHNPAKSACSPRDLRRAAPVKKGLPGTAQSQVRLECGKPDANGHENMMAGQGQSRVAP